jgi:hypothetical protein
MEQLNTSDLPDNCFPVSINVVGLSSNMPTEEGLDCLREAIDTIDDSLCRHVLALSIFNFDEKLFQQLLDTFVRTCSCKETLKLRLYELKAMLCAKQHSKNILNQAMEREVNLKLCEKKQNDRKTLVVTYNPKLPSVSKMVKHHRITMTKDSTLLELFPKPPMAAFKQPSNL